MSVLVPIIFCILVIAFVAYILKRDSAVDEGEAPWVVSISKYTLTPSRWFWRKVRENKRASVASIVVVVFAVWFWLK